MKKRTLNLRIRVLAIIVALLLTVSTLFGCAGSGSGSVKVKLDPKNPVVITVWHYYNGAIMNAFNALAEEFNETVGAEMGIIVEGFGMGNVSDLEKEVLASANKEVGSQEMPNIFASYADTAHTAEKIGLLADLGKYFTVEEQGEYISSYIEEGIIGLEGELRIFPIAKSTEILMVNETDWQPFAQSCDLSYDDLSTMQGIAQVAEMYYEWTDGMTADVPDDGKSFFGRDSMANMFIIASKEYGTEIFGVSSGKAGINVNAEVMRKIWDYYYVPYISGHYSAYGKFRSDDAKVGDILAYVGSTSSASYFPTEVTAEGIVYPIKAKVLPAPGFEGPNHVVVQQGAGMVVTKSTDKDEYASVVFLKWFTDELTNIRFSALSGYMPVKKSANNYEKIMSALADSGNELSELTEMTLLTALEEISAGEMYTNKAFDGGAGARAILEHNLQDKAAADREGVLEMLASGASLSQAVGTYNTDESFNAWLTDLTNKLNEAAQ